MYKDVSNGGACVNNRQKQIWMKKYFIFLYTEIRDSAQIGLKALKCFLWQRFKKNVFNLVDDIHNNYMTRPNEL